MRPTAAEEGPQPSRGADEAARVLRQGLILALDDVSQGRAQLADAVQRYQALGNAPGCALALRVAAAAQLVFMGIADDDYAGFEDAVAIVGAGPALTDEVVDVHQALLLRAGALVAGRFSDLDAAGLAGQCEALVAALGDSAIATPVRCCAGLVALDHHQMRMDLESVLWIELALRPLRTDPAVGLRLADELFHMLVQSLYQCGAAARAEAMRAERASTGLATLPAIALKLHLLDAQMALGAGKAEAGHAALARAEPLLHPAAPRPAGWWHLLRSRLDLLQGRHRQALTHARLALRLSSQSRLPERWMGVTVMQEGQVLMAEGAHERAWPFFERAGRATSGSQARFCWCLAHLARALHQLGRDEVQAGRIELAAGLALARELSWLHFFRAVPAVAAALCAHALELDVEAAFVREVIATRGLHAARQDLSNWPWPVRLRTLGGLRIELQGQPLAFKGKVARKPLDLLLFIIASGGNEVSTRNAAFALWPELDGDKAHAALNVALHRLRKLLGNERAVLLELGRLSVNPQLVWVDCLAFESLADSVAVTAGDALSPSARAAAERALGLYSGAFLQGSEDEAWQMVYRSRLASQCKRLVRLLALAAIASGRTGAARALLERGLELDPLAEDLARELMREQADSGETAAALAVFERCRAAIAGLGVAPSPATLALFERIRNTNLAR